MDTATRQKLNQKQKGGDLSVHHPIEKENFFITTYNQERLNGNQAFEYFSGHNYMTNVYVKNNLIVEGNDIKDTNIDSYLLFHKHIYEKRKFDLIDLDPYGLPFKFFPDVYLLMNDKCYLYVTAVKYYVPILSWRRKMKFLGYFQKEKPSHQDYISFIKRMGLAHGFNVAYVDGFSVTNNVYRFCFFCEYQRNKPSE